MARPSSLTPELRQTIERELADGIPVAIVAQNANVSRSTLHSWVSAGRVVRRRRRDPLTLVARPSESDGPEPESLRERLRAAEPGLVAAIVNAAQRGSWQSAAWLLERIAPERWAKPTQPRSTYVEAFSRTDDPFAEVDELARRRREKLGR